jgi:hypothetical protein
MNGRVPGIGQFRNGQEWAISAYIPGCPIRRDGAFPAILDESEDDRFRAIPECGRIEGLRAWSK